MVITFAVWGGTAKKEFLFPSSQFYGQKIFLPEILATSGRIFFLSLTRELSPFYLREVLYSFSLTSPNCQHPYSCVWGLLLSKIRVPWAQALRYCNNNPITKTANKWLTGGIHWTKWRSISQVRQSEISSHYLKKVCNLGPMNYLFPEFFM